MSARQDSPVMLYVEDEVSDVVLYAPRVQGHVGGLAFADGGGRK